MANCVCLLPLLHAISVLAAGHCINFTVFPQAEKRAMELLNSPEQKALTDKLLAQQQQVAAIRECKAEVQRAIALEQDADGHPSDAEYGRFYRGQLARNGPKYEDTSAATACTAATGTTGSTLRRLFSWGCW